MRFTRRDMMMIEYLRDYEVLELDSMSEYLGVSVKTLKNQLKELAEMLKEFGVDIRFVSGNQLMVRGHEKFAEVMSVSIPRFEMEFERRFLLLLVLHDNFLTIQEIADELLVSKSYAEKHLASIMKKYPEDIQAQRHYGIRYAASQNKRREVFVKILFPYLFGEDYIVALEQFDSLHFPLFHYFTRKQMERTRGAVLQLQGLEWFQLTDESLQQLFLYILFLVRHADSGNTERPAAIQEDFINTQEFDGLFEWIPGWCQEFGLPDSKEELRYMYTLLLSLRKQKIACQDQIMEKMRHPIQEILKGIAERLSVDFCNDEDLVEGLSSHIYTTILRGNHLDIETDAYMVKSMKRQYPFGFEMAAIAADYIADMYNLSMKENDLIYLAIHFQAAIERMKDEGEKTKIIIVCHFGAAAARIIRSKIERKLVGVKVTGMYSLQEFKSLSHLDCDCIVTTERILKADFPIIYISMALSEREMRKIEEGIKEIQVNHLLELNILEAIILPIEEKNMESAIKAMVQPLQEEDFVTEEYMQSVLSREEMSSTSLNYIALPHGNPAMVHNTRLVIGRMNQPLLWDDSKVSCAFLFAVSAEMLREKPMLFNTFYRTMADPNVEESIKKLQMEKNLPDEVFRQKLFHILR